MTITTSTLRPGLLVALKTTVVGNVRYSKTVIQGDTEDADGGLVARWETERHIADRKEHEEAGRVRSRARKQIARICSLTAFGLVCPEYRAPDLNEAVDNARAEVDAFNANAKLTRIDFAILTGRVAADDVEAIRAINSEVRDLLASLEQGVRNLNPEAIREAASRVRSVSQLLSNDAREQVSSAIEAARATAKQLAKATETAAVEVDQQALQAIAQARTAFLDIDGDAADVQAPQADARAVEFEIEIGSAPGVAQPTFAAREIEA
jgi:hypothetical protein